MINKQIIIIVFISIRLLTSRL